MNASLILPLAFLFVCCGAGLPGCAPGGSDPDLHGAWDRLLATYVRDGRVDYDGLAKSGRPALEAYLKDLVAVDPESLGRKDQLAYAINLYNAHMFLAVIENRAKDHAWTPPANDFAVFKEKRIRLRDRMASLDDLEHRLIRPRFKDHRIHAALVCGAESCPRLMEKAYRGADLDETLDARMKLFLEDRRLNRVDRESRTLAISALFEWFRDDFGGEAGVRKILAAHFGEGVKDYRIEHIEYSWKLNIQIPEAGSATGDPK